MNIINEGSGIWLFSKYWCLAWSSDWCLTFPNCAAATCKRRASSGPRAVCAAPAEEDRLVHPPVRGAHRGGPAPGCSSFSKALYCSADSYVSSSQLPASQNLQYRILLLGKMRSFRSEGHRDGWERGRVISRCAEGMTSFSRSSCVASDQFCRVAWDFSVRIRN